MCVVLKELEYVSIIPSLSVCLPACVRACVRAWVCLGSKGLESAQLFGNGFVTLVAAEKELNRCHTSRLFTHAGQLQTWYINSVRHNWYGVVFLSSPCLSACCGHTRCVEMSKSSAWCSFMLHRMLHVKKGLLILTLYFDSCARTNWSEQDTKNEHVRDGKVGDFIHAHDLSDQEWHRSSWLLSLNAFTTFGHLNTGWHFSFIVLCSEQCGFFVWASSSR